MIVWLAKMIVVSGFPFSLVFSLPEAEEDQEESDWFGASITPSLSKQNKVPLMLLLDSLISEIRV